MAIFDSVGTTQRSSKLLSQFLYYKDEWSCKVYKHLPKACSSYVEDDGSYAVWPDLAIYWTLGNFLKPLATINFPKSPNILRQLW